MVSNVSSLQKAERELVVNFPIKEVQDAMMFLFEKFPGKYILRKNDINEVFKTYHFPISNNLNPAIADIVLTDEGNKTKIHMTVTNAAGALSSNSILSGLLNDYLVVLGKVLNKESIEEITQTVKNSGCMVLLVVGSIATTMMCMLF